MEARNREENIPAKMLQFELKEIERVGWKEERLLDILDAAGLKYRAIGSEWHCSSRRWMNYFRGNSESIKAVTSNMGPGSKAVSSLVSSGWSSILIQ